MATNSLDDAKPGNQVCTMPPLPLQFIYAGRKATLVVGNIKPLGEMPEGTIVCCVEEVRTEWLQG